MSVQLERIVSVIRSGSRPVLDGDALSVRIQAGVELLNTLEAIHASNTVRVFDNGIELYVELQEIQVGRLIDVTVARVQGQSFHLAQNLAELVEYQGGRFLVHRPPAWYLIDEDFLNGEPTESVSIGGYNRLPEFLSFFEAVADFTSTHETRRSYVFLANERLDVPVVCGAAALAELPTSDEIRILVDEVLAPPQVKAKKGLYKRALLRYLDSVSDEGRFEASVRGFATITKSFEASRDNFLSDFEFDKLTERFERKREEYMLKIDAVCGELLTKVLALPVAQAIVVSQYKAGAPLSNVALLVGSGIVAILGAAFVSNQVHAIGEIRTNAKRERQDVERRHPELYSRIRNSYDSVLHRLSVYGRALPGIVIVVLLLSFVISLFGFDQVEPCDGCIKSALGSVADVLSRWAGRR